MTRGFWRPKRHPRLTTTTNYQSFDSPMPPKASAPVYCADPEPNQPPLRYAMLRGFSAHAWEALVADNAKDLIEVLTLIFPCQFVCRLLISKKIQVIVAGANAEGMFPEDFFYILEHQMFLGSGGNDKKTKSMVWTAACSCKVITQ